MFVLCPGSYLGVRKRKKVVASEFIHFPQSISPFCPPPPPWPGVNVHVVQLAEQQSYLKSVSSHTPAIACMDTECSSMVAMEPVRRHVDRRACR